MQIYLRKSDGAQGGNKNHFFKEISAEKRKERGKQHGILKKPLKHGNGEEQRYHGSSKKLVEKDPLKKEMLRRSGGENRRYHGSSKTVET